ncbi:Peroxisomal coenzyme A diphosphatase 1 [Cladobotryum mycophilum]|uniref:Peroxisomal coenzyme A diphosphatase 1 n=1 Tax=Cladobotryum mycophilum TaxID=491253 RepID=A0ABR0SE68_9HYPO
MTEASPHESTTTTTTTTTNGNLEKELLEESVALTHDQVTQVRDHISSLLELGDQLREADYTGASLYYDASTMASLNPKALAAINRFRAYKPPPFPTWDTLPARKRAAVLILLFADRWGDLRVVVTMRAASLRNFSGHAALPGGKADSVDETPYQIARREAYEEIGLPMEDSRIPKPFRIEQLCSLPPAMARTHIVVTPCVAFLHADRTSPDSPPALVEESMIPRLDAREVAAVFTAPFYNFLKVNDLPPHPGETLPPGRWYEGFWIDWEGFKWKSHNYYVPINNQKVSRPRQASAAQVEASNRLEDDQGDEDRFRVWGMTGRVLLDAARIAYQEVPEMEHNEDLGDGEIIEKAVQEGMFEEVGSQRKEEHKPAKM